MDLKNYLVSELTNNYEFIQTLISEVSEDAFFRKSAHSNANIAWQIGHSCLANYGQIVGYTGRVEKFPPLNEFEKLKEYCAGLGDVNRFMDASHFSKEQLMQLLKEVFALCKGAILDISYDEYNNALPQVPFPHPSAETVGDILGYAIRHEMWHCAEIEALKREFELNHVFLE